MSTYEYIAIHIFGCTQIPVEARNKYLALLSTLNKLALI